MVGRGYNHSHASMNVQYPTSCQRAKVPTVVNYESCNDTFHDKLPGPNTHAENSFNDLKKKSPGVVVKKQQQLDHDDDASILIRFVRRFDVVGFVMEWLEEDAKFDEPASSGGKGALWKRQKRTYAVLVRTFVYDPKKRKISSIAQHLWIATLIGALLGIFVGFWKMTIEAGNDLIWESIPSMLQDAGVPYLEYYTVPVMTVLTVVSALMFARRPNMPDQNTFLDDFHRVGGPDSIAEFWPLVVSATLGMWSGGSLGPELPLLMASGMIGSILWRRLKLKSLEQRQIIVLTAQAAAISAFFKIPGGGCFFALELPYRSGMQHAVALIPGMWASFISTMVYCWFMKEPLEGMFDFPDIPGSLPNWIFGPAALFSLISVLPGIMYLKKVKSIKKLVHKLTHFPEAPKYETLADCDTFYEDRDANHYYRSLCSGFQIPMLFLASLVTSVICLIFPHCFSWGEAQLQTLIDAGQSELPYFDKDSPLVAPFAMCMPDPDGLDWKCMLAIPLLKMICIGIAVGTGIRCGHFWGPLFVGCAASQLVLGFMRFTGWGSDALSPYTGAIILLMMASAHVVTFRSYLGISFILLQASEENIKLLILLTFVTGLSMAMTSSFVFYTSQQNEYDDTLHDINKFVGKFGIDINDSVTDADDFEENFKEFHHDYISNSVHSQELQRSGGFSLVV